MQPEPGIFIVLEGSDGSGKTTQFRLLTERLRAVGYDVAVFEFPRYNEESSYFIKRYLNGDYGPASSVSPYTASLFYALDRFEAAPQIRQALNEGKIVLADRYVGSNMAHQGSKFADPVQQRGFFVWEDSLEFQLLGIPRPNINLFLRVPAELARELIKQRGTSDEHEKDIKHLKQTVTTYDLLCQLFPKDFMAIYCTTNDQLLSIADINNQIWELILPLLPAKPIGKARGGIVRLNEVLDNKPPVQSVSSTKPSQPKPSNSQIVQIQLKNISLLASGFAQTVPGVKVEAEIHWLKTKPIYDFYTPSDLQPPAKKDYKLAMDDLVSQHQKLVTKLAKSRTLTPGEHDDLVLRTIPLATLADISISGEPGSLTTLVDRLRQSQMPEQTWLAEQIETKLSQQKKSSTRPGKNNQPLSQTVDRLTRNNLPQSHAMPNEPVQLMSIRPRNEFDLLTDGLYPHTNLSSQEIMAEMSRWTYDQKRQALTALALARDENVIGQANYRFDVIIDRIGLDQLIELGLAQDIQIQPPTPRYGYQVPATVDKAVVEDEFLELFDTSLAAFSQLQAANQDGPAPYVVLLGHKGRCQLSFTAKGYVTVRDQLIKNRNLKEIVEAFEEKISESHPLIAQSLLRSRASEIPKARQRTQARHRSRARRKS